MAITAQEFKKIGDIVVEAVSPLEKRLTTVGQNLDTLTTNIDQFLTIVRRHEQEWLILRTQHQKMREILVKKGIATESELSITQ